MRMVCNDDIDAEERTRPLSCVHLYHDGFLQVLTFYVWVQAAGYYYYNIFNLCMTKSSFIGTALILFSTYVCTRLHNAFEENRAGTNHSKAWTSTIYRTSGDDYVLLIFDHDLER
jgi:hypothetical protein